MKEIFEIQLRKEKGFEDKKLTSIKVEGRITRHLEFIDDKEVFIGYNSEDSIECLGLISIERNALNKELEPCEKPYKVDVTPCYKNEQNFYKFMNDRRIFERLIKEMVELMGRTDKDDATVEFGFYCEISNVKASLLQAMELEMEDKLKEIAKDRFFKIEPSIKEFYGDKK